MDIEKLRYSINRYRARRKYLQTLNNINQKEIDNITNKIFELQKELIKEKRRTENKKGE